MANRQFAAAGRVGVAVGAATAARLGSVEVMVSFDGPVTAYVHVPCRERICLFCPCDKVRAEEGLARRYFTVLRW